MTVERHFTLLQIDGLYTVFY